MSTHDHHDQADDPHEAFAGLSLEPPQSQDMSRMLAPQEEHYQSDAAQTLIHQQSSQQQLQAQGSEAHHQGMQRLHAIGMEDSQKATAARHRI